MSGLAHIASTKITNNGFRAVRACPYTRHKIDRKAWSIFIGHATTNILWIAIWLALSATINKNNADSKKHLGAIFPSCNVLSFWVISQVCIPRPSLPALTAKQLPLLFSACLDGM